MLMARVTWNFGLARVRGACAKIIDCNAPIRGDHSDACGRHTRFLSDGAGDDSDALTNRLVPVICFRAKPQAGYVPVRPAPHTAMKTLLRSARQFGNAWKAGRGGILRVYDRCHLGCQLVLSFRAFYATLVQQGALRPDTCAAMRVRA